MIDLILDVVTGLVKPARALVFKAAPVIPVRITLSADPGGVPVFELALSAQNAVPSVLAYLDSFEAGSATVYTGELDGTDTRLVDHLSDKSAPVPLDCELSWTLGGDRKIAPNVPVTAQRPIVSGPASSEGGPTYLTQAQADALYLKIAELLAEIDSGDRATARGNLGIVAGAMVNKVAVPAGYDSAGVPGDFAHDQATATLWIYTGDGATHTWVSLAGANAA